MPIRAKFTVNSVTQRGWTGEVTQELIEANPVYCNREHPTAEDKAACESHSYSEATPDGKLELLITNKAIFGTFKPGSKFYLDFTPAD